MVAMTMTMVTVDVFHVATTRTTHPMAHPMAHPITRIGGPVSHPITDHLGHHLHSHLHLPVNPHLHLRCRHCHGRGHCRHCRRCHSWHCGHCLRWSCNWHWHIPLDLLNLHLWDRHNFLHHLHLRNWH